jgi:hypothetical protein
VGIRRIGIGLQDHLFERLNAACQATGATQNGLFAAMLSVCSDDELRNIVLRYQKLQEIERELRETADQRLLSYIRGRRPEDLQSMLDQMRKVV